MRSIQLITFILFFALLMPYSANGQHQSNVLGIGAELASIRLAGGEKGDSNINNSTGVRVAYFATDYLSVGYTGLYGHVQPRKGNSFFAADPTLPFKTFLFSHALDVSFYLPIKKRLHPFVGGGTGLLIWDLRNVSDGGSFFKNGFFYGQSLFDGPVYNTTLNAFIGVDYPVKDNFVLTAFMRYTHIFDQNLDNIGTNDKNNKILQLGLSFSYRLFGRKDSDGDGIFDKEDGAPLLAEDFDGFQDDDGIPDYDNDGDGVPDDVDKAPMVAEDRDGFEDDDGVPDPDNDWDGIPDTRDGAPNEPEDFDGYQDDDGVPDLDDDGDGIPDLVDRCKDAPETMNGYRDDDGCPDEVPKPLMAKGEKIILKGVNFEVNSAELTKESHAILDEVFESLYAHPEIEVEIRGYTDNTGDAEYNLKLSQARAETVRQYLIEKGIDSYRLKAKGYGEQNPIADNSTPEGRAKNRRIEFYRIN